MVDRALRPQIFEIEPSHPNAEKKYRHWKTTLQNYLTTLPAPVHAAGATPDAIAQATLAHNQKKFYALVNNVSAEVYELVSETTNLTEAIAALDAAYIRPRSVVYNRHKLITLKQEAGQSIDDFKQQLERIAKTCEFQAVTAQENRNNYMCEAFVSGISAPYIRQRLLEHVGDLTLDAAYATARSLEQAQTQSATYESGVVAAAANVAAVPDADSIAAMRNNSNNNSNIRSNSERESGNDEACWFCGDTPRHPRSNCRARNATCHGCGKKVCGKSLKSSLPLAAIGQLSSDPPPPPPRLA